METKLQRITVCKVWFTVMHDDDDGDGPGDEQIVDDLKSLVDNYPDLVVERTEVTEDSHLVEDEAEGKGAS